MDLLTAPGEGVADAELAASLGKAGHAGVAAWLTTPAEFAGNVRAVVDSVL